MPALVDPAPLVVTARSFEEQTALLDALSETGLAVESVGGDRFALDAHPLLRRELRTVYSRVCEHRRLLPMIRQS